MPEQYYLFDPIQFKEFGYEFYQGENFYYRYQFSKKIFWKNIYIPYGPNCQTKQGFLNFIEHINKIKFAKITIDLPIIYCKERKNEVIKILENNGYKKIPYIHQDEETIIFDENRFKLNSKIMNKVRRGLKRSKVIIKNHLTKEELRKIYEIYLISSKRIGFKPKNIEVFKKISENCLISLAFSKESVMLGFVFGYLFNICAKDFLDKDVGKILMIMFTAQTDLGRKNKIGHAMHYELFVKAFSDYGVDLIDFHGASRSKKRTYVEFKKDFSKNFCQLPGCYIKKLYL